MGIIRQGVQLRLNKKIKLTKSRIFSKICKMKVLTIAEIKAQYPDQWVLVGNPELDDEETLGSIVDKLVRGVVLLHSKDKRELAYKASEAREGYESIACIYTGLFPRNRKYWL
jgi:hypothetical protein